MLEFDMTFKTKAMSFVHTACDMYVYTCTLNCGCCNQQQVMVRFGETNLHISVLIKELKTIQTTDNIP